MRTLFPALACLAGIAVIGCGSPETSNAPGPEPAAPACANVDPSVAGPDATCGVFVSASLGSDDNPGTMERPFRTLAQAFAAAPEGARRVYACAELFAEAAELPAGVELWGGLACADGWAYAGGAVKTTIAPGVAGVIPVRVLSGEAPVRIADVRAEAAHGEEPGQSSIAAMVLPGTPVEILRSELVAGNGAPGADGEAGAGPDGPLILPPGADGLPGGAACQSVVNPGGASVMNVCDDLVSISGKGGDGRVILGDDGADGAPWPDPNPLEYGLGGYGENSGHTQCDAGNVGLGGQDGEHGLGGRGYGRLTMTGWEGEKGQDGTDGRSGQAGGGGGALRGATTFECAGGKGGSGGGSGGAGGCGGKGGKGGGYGGASISLVALSGGVEVRATTLRSGSGGDGGQGGLWQGGGHGGEGGPGGPSAASNIVHTACRGARGGKGGNGGFGGGGLGGISVGIAHIEGLPLLQEDVSIETGLGGLGGPDSHPWVTLSESSGDEGYHGETLGFPAP